MSALAISVGRQLQNPAFVMDVPESVEGATPLDAANELLAESLMSLYRGMPRLTVLNALAIVRKELGSLDRVLRIVRVSGHVASADGFTQQPAVINGASELLVEIFGEAGRHARLALGAAELPLNMAIELELILQIR